MRTIYLSKPIPIKDINKFNFVNITIIDHKKCTIQVFIDKPFVFYGYTNKDELLNFEIHNHDYNFIKTLLEFFIVNFGVLFLTDDDMEIIFREPDTPRELLYERSLKEFGLHKYLRYNKLKKIKGIN